MNDDDDDEKSNHTPPRTQQENNNKGDTEILFLNNNYIKLINRIDDGPQATTHHNSQVKWCLFCPVDGDIKALSDQLCTTTNHREVTTNSHHHKLRK